MTLKNLSMKTRPLFLFAAALALLSGANIARAVLVNSWVADNYSGTGNWTDGTGGIIATVNGTPVKTANAFGTHSGINFNGTSWFLAPGTGTAPGGSSSFTLAAVYSTSSAGANIAPGGLWWNGSGLIGNEEANTPADFGLSLVGTNIAGGGGNNPSGFTDYTAIAATTLNTTHAVAFVSDGSTLTLFQDGVQVAQTAVSGSFLTRDSNGFALGAIDTAGSRIFPGLVAEFQTYNSAENGVTLTNSLLSTYAVPEPSAYLMTLGGLGMLISFQRFRIRRGAKIS
jgi:hypothetical protein